MASGLKKIIYTALIGNMNIGAQVTVSRRRIHFALSSGYPHQELYMEVVDRLMQLKQEIGPPNTAS